MKGAVVGVGSGAREVCQSWSPSKRASAVARKRSSSPSTAPTTRDPVMAGRPSSGWASVQSTRSSVTDNAVMRSRRRRSPGHRKSRRGWARPCPAPGCRRCSTRPPPHRPRGGRPQPVLSRVLLAVGRRAAGLAPGRRESGPAGLGAEPLGPGAGEHGGFIEDRSVGCGRGIETLGHFVRTGRARSGPDPPRMRPPSGRSGCANRLPAPHWSSSSPRPASPARKDPA